MMRFDAASIEELGSSRTKTVGLPAYLAQQIIAEKSKISLTDECNCESKLAFVAAGEL